MPRRFHGEDTRGLKAKAQKAQAAAEKKQASDAARERTVAAQWSKGADERSAERRKALQDKEAEAERRRKLKAAAAAEDNEMLQSIKTKRKPSKVKKGSKKDPLAGLGDLSFMESSKGKFGKKKKKTKKKPSKAASQQRTVDEELEAAGLQRNTNRLRAAEEAEGHISTTGLDDTLAALTTSAKGTCCHSLRSFNMPTFDSTHFVCVVLQSTVIRSADYEQNMPRSLSAKCRL